MILFVDYDGVFHPARVFLKDGKPELASDGGEVLFMWTPLLESALASHPDIQIVLSTSWVHVLGFDTARNRLSDALRKRVTGATWHAAMDSSPYASQSSALSHWDRMTRYEQIALYVARAGVERWLAIDDDIEGWKDQHLSNLVQTHPDRGLSDEAVLLHLEKALEEQDLATKGRR